MRDVGPRMTFTRFGRIVWQRLRSIVRPGSLDREMDREMAFHLDALVAEYVADGLSPEAARRAARLAFGNVAALADRSRDVRRVSWIHDLRQDLVHGWRGLRRQPGFTAVAVLSLALGIGANAAVLSVIRMVQFDAVPFPDPDRVVTVRATSDADPLQTAGVTLVEFVDWQARNHVFEVMGASLNWSMDFGADERGAPADRVIGQAVTPGVFPTLGVAPARGRWFTDVESRIERGAAVVVLSHRLWMRRFAGDPNVLSRRIRMNGVLTEIVGVMPERFRFLDRRAEFWVPLRIQPGAPDLHPLFAVVGRLKPGATIEQARAEMTAFGLLPASRESRGRRAGVRVDPMSEVMYGWATSPLLTIEAAVAFVFLIACANVAGLLLARGAARQRELALRAALGAGRGRLIRQLVTESALVAAIGGVAGAGVATAGLRVLLASMSAPVGSPRLAAIAPDAWTIALIVGIAALTVVLVGIVPALACSRLTLSAAANDAPASGVWRLTRPARSRHVLVGVQIAWAMVLLAGAGLLLNSFVRLAQRDMHFDERGLLTFDYRPPGPFTRPVGSIRGYTYLDVTTSSSDALAPVLDRLRRVPGAQAVAGISHQLVNSLIVPVTGVFADGRGVPESDPDPAPPQMIYFLVTPGFFTTLRATLVAGRDVDARDVAGAPWVAVVNETAAKRLWPGEPALGKRLTLDIVPEERSREVVGVVRDIPIRRKQADLLPVVYVSYLQQPTKYRSPLAQVFGQMSFLVRTEDPIRLAPSVQQAMAEVDPDRPLANLAPITDPGVPMIELRNYVSSVTAFAIVAAVLAAIGVYGVVAYSVQQRTREIGVRRALGAGTREILVLVSRSALGAAVLGLAAGLAGSFLLTRFIESQLWGVTPTDPGTFVAATVLLVVTAGTACFIPARRALAVDPSIALRD